MRNTYEGIEKTNINSISLQLSDDEKRKFEDLLRVLTITTDEEKKRKIREEMAKVIGVEATNEDSQDLEVKPKEIKKQQEKTDKEVMPNTIYAIREEYERINEELIRGNRSPELYERYLLLKAQAEKLGEEVVEDIGVEVENDKTGESEKDETVSLPKDIQEMLDEIPAEAKGPRISEIEITPEELEILLGDIPKRDEDTESDIKPNEREKAQEHKQRSNWFRNIGKKLANLKLGKTGDVIQINPEAIDEDYGKDLLPESYVLSQEKMEEIETESGTSSQEKIEEIETKSDTSAQEAAERDTVVQEGKRDLLEEIKGLPNAEKRKVFDQMLDDLFGKKEVVAKAEVEKAKEEETEAEKAKSELKRGVKEYVKEHPVIEKDGKRFSDLPSRMALAELELAKKLNKDRTLIAIDGKAFSLKKDGKMIELELGNGSQNPFAVAKNNKELGSGDRGRKTGEEIEYGY